MFSKDDDMSKQPTLDKEELELLRKCCETVSHYAYEFDRRMYKHLATPQKEE